MVTQAHMFVNSLLRHYIGTAGSLNPLIAHLMPESLHHHATLV